MYLKMGEQFFFLNMKSINEENIATDRKQEIRKRVF